MVTNNKYLLRFLVLFIGLITIPFPFNVIPKLKFIEKAIFGVFLLLTIAILGTITWSIFDKKNRNYEKLNYWFLVLSRYSLGYYMIHYGLFKIMPLQFGEIDFWRMLQPYGESSPMGLAWTFLGYSKGYNIFMGRGVVPPSRCD